MIRRLFLLVFLAASGACAAPSSYTQTIPGTGISFDMVYLPQMGSWIGKHEVTWAEYQKFCDEYESPPPGVDAITRPSPPGHGIPPGGLGGGKQPAMGVSWNGAKKYCEWLSRKTGLRFRLPSEREWEFACRGGETGAYPFGDSPETLGDFAWYSANSGGTTHEVGLKKPNAFGLFDMLGNALEYTADPFSPGSKTPVLRGGSFSDGPEELRCDVRQEFRFEWIERDPQRPRSRWWAFDGPVGFRLAR